MKSREDYITLFSQLGERLSGFGGDDATRIVMSAAAEQNQWFSPEDIVFAVNAIREDMLHSDVLCKWLDDYTKDYSSRKRVGVIMAGNIPLVGFADLMCVLACGQECYVKPSSKDDILIRYVIGLLREIWPEVPVCDYSDDAACDAVIATGSDNTNRYFRARFAGIPSLLRGSRASAAVLTGGETEEQLRGLSEDIFRYNGMGCRSVSLLFVPEGYNVAGLSTHVAPENTNPKYRNNYLQARALISVRGRPFVDGGNFLMADDRDFPHTLSLINYAYYKDIEEVRGWLADNEGGVQTVVSSVSVFPRMAAFGWAQRPAPWDYPDGRDVMDFLISI